MRQKQRSRPISDLSPNRTTPKTLSDFVASDDTASSTKATTSRLFKTISSSETVKGNVVLVQEQVEAAIAEISTMDWNDDTAEELSLRLFKTIEEFGDKAVNVLAHLIIQEKIPAPIAACVLRCLGAIKDETTRPYRLWLEARSLFSRSVRIRDGAVVGLSLMESPDSLPYLKKAMNSERHTMLRRDMMRLIAYLEKPSNAVLSEKD
jgi:hypothetical protein